MPNCFSLQIFRSLSMPTVLDRVPNLTVFNFWGQFVIGMASGLSKTVNNNTKISLIESALFILCALRSSISTLKSSTGMSIFTGISLGSRNFFWKKTWLIFLWHKVAFAGKLQLRLQQSRSWLNALQLWREASFFVFFLFFCFCFCFFGGAGAGARFGSFRFLVLMLFNLVIGDCGELSH